MSREKRNFDRLCGRCSKPCGTSWCCTLDKPEDFEKYTKEKQKKETVDIVNCPKNIKKN